MKILLMLIQLILVLSFVACSTQNKTPQPHEHLEGVEIKSSADTQITPLKENAIAPQVDSEIKKTEQPSEIIPVAGKVSTKPGINLLIGPGGYHSFGCVGFLKSLEKKHIRIKEISGIEMGGLIAALYAKHLKSSVVEWEIFKLINKLDEDEAPYTAHWNQVMANFINRNFDAVDFSDLKIALKISALTGSGEVEWSESGNVAKVLLESLNIKPEAFKKFIWPEKIEGEELISIDLLSLNLQFKQKNSELYYKGYLGLIKEMRKQSSQTINLKFNQGYVDSFKNWQNNGPVAQAYGTQLAKSLLIKNLKTE